MAAAISALLKNQVQRIVLTRPAVEAGEALGFLPATCGEKILPTSAALRRAARHARPPEDVATLSEKGVIENRPAGLHGAARWPTLHHPQRGAEHLDEQMMMFLTRLGDDSRMIITGTSRRSTCRATRPPPRAGPAGWLPTSPGIESTTSPHRRRAHPLVQKIMAATSRPVSAEPLGPNS